MITIKSFVFGPFQENTYVLWDETKEAVIIDPGNSSVSEHQQLKTFIEAEKLNLKRLILTHAHIDHISGNRFVYDTWKLLPEVHKEDLAYIERHKNVAMMYGLPCEESPLPEKFLKEGETVSFGNSKLEMIFTPGHSPGSITFYCREQNFVIAGDVLFYGSIGRTDLPGGNHDTLINSIKQKLFPLGDDVKVYSGHGPETTIGFEKENNPFL
jgi:glyoxylase-like metal-dependent hydrolase (beta-lactamase superfamily II)